MQMRFRCRMRLATHRRLVGVAVAAVVECRHHILVLERLQHFCSTGDASPSRELAGPRCTPCGAELTLNFAHCCAGLRLVPPALRQHALQSQGDAAAMLAGMTISGRAHLDLVAPGEPRLQHMMPRASAPHQCQQDSQQGAPCILPCMIQVRENNPRC